MVTPHAPRRNAAIALAVVATHAAAIWTLQSGWVMQEEVERVIPVSLLAATLPPPVAESPQGRPAAPRPEPEAKPPAPRPAQPAPAKLERSAPSGVTPKDQAPSAAPGAGAGAPSAAPQTLLHPDPAPVSLGPNLAQAAAPPAAAGLTLPSTDADHLRNPPPAYPALSRRLNEQGTVVHSVLIAADGRPVSARLVQSSGFDRLDKAAYIAVMQWRYVPGKRQGVPEAMRYEVPIKWVLE